jgi:hypothetical protein
MGGRREQETLTALGGSWLNERAMERHVEAGRGQLVFRLQLLIREPLGHVPREHQVFSGTLEPAAIADCGIINIINIKYNEILYEY